METERDLLPENDNKSIIDDELHVEINPEEKSPVVFAPTGKSPKPIPNEYSIPELILSQEEYSDKEANKDEIAEQKN